MQSLCGRIRFSRGHKINGTKIIEIKANWRDDCTRADHGLMSSLVSNGGVAAANFTGFSNCSCPVYSSSLLSKFVSSSALILRRRFVSRAESSINYSSHSVPPVIKGSSTARVPKFTSRSITTMGKSSEPSTQDTSPPVSDVAPRIKFKRLDKTARHIMQIIDKEAVEQVKVEREIPDIKPGYIVQLKVEVPENKRRVSVVKGIVIARRNAGLNTTFRLRRLVAGVGVESLFPLYSPNIKDIKVLDKKKVRRAKLYYLRDKMNALKKQ